jgi:hypothetical protein
MIQVLKLDDAIFVEDTLDVHIVASQSHFGLANNNFLLLIFIRHFLLGNSTNASRHYAPGAVFT